MAISSAIIKTFQFSALATAVALAGCGGGGGNDTIQPEVGSGSGSSSGNTGGTSTTSSVNVTNISLVDSSGNVTSTINSSGANAVVKVTDSSGKGISGAIVKFTSTGGLTFGTTNGSVLTNANGEASISVKPTNATDTGAYSLSASVVYNGSTATTPDYNFSLQPANITLSNVTAASTSLTSGGSTNITLVTTDATSNTAQNNVAVNFTASCGSFTNSTVTSSNQGNITTTYKGIDDNGNLCEGVQTITATTASGNVSKTVSVNIAPIQASSIVYTSTNDVSLATKNSGSSSSGQIEFTVYSNGTPAANQKVVISKTYAPSDFSFGSLGNQSNITLTSDSSGKVSVNLYPGTLPGPVELKAALANDLSVSTLSKNVTVINSRATQNGITMTVEKNVLLNNTTDSTKITMRFTNRNGTNIPAGTVVNFVTEGGKVDPSCSTDVNGICTVTFTSQQPRPTNGRVSLLAYLEGDKQYTDIDGDNNYTAGIDTLVDNIGDFYRDDNENNQYDSSNGEFVYRRGSTESCGNNIAPLVGSLPNSLSSFLNFFYQPNIDKTCNTGLETTLRSQVILGLASDTPIFQNLNLRDGGTFYMYGNSMGTVSMPSGTKIEISAKDNTSDNKMTCEPKLTHGSTTGQIISKNTSFTVPAIVDLVTVNDGGNFFQYSAEPMYGITNLLECDKEKDDIILTVTAPNGAVTKISTL